MAKRITEFTSATVLAETDVLPVVDLSDTTQATSGTTKKLALSLIADYLKARVETLTNKTLTSPKINEDVVLTATSTELNKITGMLDWFYPVGTIYETTSTDLDTTTKMATHFGGTWEAYGSGRVLVGKSADTEFDTIGETGGAKTHTHRQGGPSSDSSGSAGGAISGPWNDGTFGRSSSGVTFGNYSQIVSEGVGSAKTVYPFLTEATSSLSPYIVVYRYRRVS